MSVREEDKQRNCPGRGLGIAAAAIGVGVGAALYYFFNKRSENPDAAGSTSNWACDDHALQDSYHETEDTTNMDTSGEWESHDDFTTGSSETTQTSSSDFDTYTEDSDTMSNSSHSHDTSLDHDMDWTYSDSSEAENSYMTISEHSTTDTSMNTSTERPGRAESTHVIDSSDEGSVEFISSSDVPSRDADSGRTGATILGNMFHLVRRPRNDSKRLTEEIQRLANIREQAFRERTWTVEECSICFEPMQRNQEVLALPCTHRFHQPCILPWLQERQTCPNCRKEA